MVGITCPASLSRLLIDACDRALELRPSFQGMLPRLSGRTRRRDPERSAAPPVSLARAVPAQRWRPGSYRGLDAAGNEFYGPPSGSGTDVHLGRRGLWSRRHLRIMKGGESCLEH